MLSIGDALLKMGVDTKDLEAGLKGVQQTVQASVDGIQRNVGIGMTATGGAILGILSVATKAAADEDVGIQRLAKSMENVGLVYEGANGSLEKWINNQMLSTGFADDEQREALSSLIVLTKDQTKAQELLTIAMDLARWKNIDLGTSMGIVQKVYAGNTGVLTRYGIIIDENSTKEEALAAIQKKAAGQAEVYGKTADGQAAILKNSMDDLMEDVGSVVLPILTDLLKAISPIIQSIREWISANPELTKVIVVGSVALGVLFTILGSFLLILPGLTAATGIFGITLNAAIWPVTLIAVGIAALIAVGVLLWQNWDTVSAKAKEVWGGVVDFFKGVWNALVSGFEWYLNIYVDGINTIIGLVNSIPGINLGPVGRVDLGGLKAYGAGGEIAEPTLLYGLKSMKPYAIAGENGPERVGPAGNVSNYFQGPWYIREEADINRIARELFSLQQSTSRGYGV